MPCAAAVTTTACRNREKPEQIELWRGSLLPLGCEAAPKAGTAAQSSGSKLPRHRSICSPGIVRSV
ncbi:hypothetical protein EJA72_14200 [Pseudomonas sp. PB120]|nr:hypothetical protein [Pseudomonas sp. PB120]